MYPYFQWAQLTLNIATMTPALIWLMVVERQAPPVFAESTDIEPDSELVEAVNLAAISAESQPTGTSAEMAANLTDEAAESSALEAEISALEHPSATTAIAASWQATGGLPLQTRMNTNSPQRDNDRVSARSLSENEVKSAAPAANRGLAKLKLDGHLA